MHIALINGFPRLSSAAEVEYIKRFVKAGSSLGHHVYEVITSDDIHACEPDFVLATHEFSAKLTPFFTVGALWSPPEFYDRDPLRVRSILSYDAYLVGAESVGRFIDDLEFSTGIKKSRSEFLFLPAALASDYTSRPIGASFSVAYIGVHWDGQRHGGLLSELARTGYLNLYGPPNSWKEYGQWYRGPVPFDGASVITALSRHGIALCLHKEEHRRADTPSMRLFEAGAAGCLIISDEIPFARRVLGENAFYLDLNKGAKENSVVIKGIVQWANENPELANAMAARSHKILKEQFSIESQVEKCCEFVNIAKQRKLKGQGDAIDCFALNHTRQAAGISSDLDKKARPAFAVTLQNPKKAIVDVIVRTGGRDLQLLRRALRCITQQNIGTYRILVVDYKGRDDVRILAEQEQTSRVKIEYLRCEDTGARSTALWAGLQQVTAPFFANLDDDDTISPDHFSSLLKVASDFPDHDLYYSGCIRVEEDQGDHVAAPNFAGPMEIEIPERKELRFLEKFNLARLVSFDNFVASNSFIARTDCLDARTLLDPHLIVGEDMYLLFMLARRKPFKANMVPTAFWHWRSTSQDNSMLKVDPDIWGKEGQKLISRLSQEQYYNGLTFNALQHLMDRKSSEWIWPSLPAKISPGEEFYLTSKYVIHGRQRNFHMAEASGVWSASTDATLQIRLTEAVTNVGLRLSFMVAGETSQSCQPVYATVNGQVLFKGEVNAWALTIAERNFQFSPSTYTLFIRVRCGQTVNPKKLGMSDDERDLGVFISTISYTHMVAFREKQRLIGKQDE